MVTDIIYETRDQWEYEQLSEEDDFIIQKVADILKDEPRGFALCDGSFNMCQGEVKDED